MYFVYILRSISHRDQTYVGHTEDVNTRLSVHNSGSVPSTARFRPWEFIAYIAVNDEQTAIDLERYFKTGSGHAFWHKRFM